MKITERGIWYETYLCNWGSEKYLIVFSPAVYEVMKTYNRLGIEGGRAAWSKKVIGIGGSSSGN